MRKFPQNPPPLRLVAAAEGSPPLGRLDLDALVRRSPGRPSDRLQECWLPASEGLCELARRAARRRLDLVTAFSLCAERQLITEELGDQHMIDELDRLAAEARASGELAPASAKYLRMLSGRGPSSPPPSLSGDVRLALPVRLSERVHWAGLLSGAVHAEGLESAVAWEAAALVEGRTMTEWALSQALTRLTLP